MTTEQFAALSEMEKVCTIMEHGKLMSQEVVDDCRIFIYHIDTFYVSAMYGLLNDQLISIHTFMDFTHYSPDHRRELFCINPAERV